MEQLEWVKRFHERYPILSTVAGSFLFFLITLLYFYQRKQADLTGAEFIYMDF